MQKVIAKDCNFYKAKLEGADMKSGDFENSNFTEANLSQANLEKASLQFCTMTNSNIEGANFTNLRGGIVGGDRPQANGVDPGRP